jgi:hypothetical protein
MSQKYWVFRADPGMVIGAGLIAAGLFSGMSLIADAIKATPPAKVDVVVNERAVQFGVVTKGRELKPIK